MLKHILLALCFMAYIIENIGELEPRQRKDQFDRLVKCYEQMYKYGVVSIRKDERHKLKTIEHSDDAPETSVNNKKRKLNTIIPSVDAPEVSVDNRRFEDDESFGIVKNLFTNQFTESWSPEELKKKLDDMISVHKIDVVFNYPLGVFAYNYAHKSPQEMLRSVAAYCNAYSIFIEAVN